MVGAQKHAKITQVSLIATKPRHRRLTSRCPASRTACCDMILAILAHVPKQKPSVSKRRRAQRLSVVPLFLTALAAAHSVRYGAGAPTSARRDTDSLVTAGAPSPPIQPYGAFQCAAQGRVRRLGIPTFQPRAGSLQSPVTAYYSPSTPLPDKL